MSGLRVLITNLTLASPRLRSRAAFQLYRARRAAAAWMARGKTDPDPRRAARPTAAPSAG